MPSYLILLLALGALGCRGERIPTYPNMDDPSSLRILSENARAVRTLAAQGILTLTGADEQSIRLDMAMVSQPPDRMRLRAWKFGQAVFDLTLNPDGLFLITPEKHSRKEQMKAAGASAADLLRTWSMLSGGFFDAPDLRVEPTSTHLRITRAAAGEPAIICIVDRATLTPRRYDLVDDQGISRFSLVLDRYTTVPPVSPPAVTSAGGNTGGSVHNLVWPRRFIAISEHGTITVDLREIELNGDLPSGAFIPPRRAERVP